MTRRDVAMLVGLVAALGRASTVAGQSRDQYRLDHWTTDQGLPSHTIHDLAQTTNGYLWATTTGGLVRFDGRNFRVFGSGALPNSRTFGLDAKGDTLLVTHEDAGVFRVLGDSATAVVTGLSAWDLSRDAAGITWAVGRRIQYLDSAGRVHHVSDTSTMVGVDGSAGNRPRIRRDGRGDVWVHSIVTQRVARLRTHEPLRWMDGAPRQLIVDAARGEMLFARPAGDLTRIVTERSEVRAAFPAGAGVPRLLDRRGRLWVSSGNRLEAYAGVRGERVGSVSVAAGADPTVMLEDHEGSIWIGTPEHGLYRIQAVPFRVLDKSAGFEESQVLQVSRGDSGSVLAVTRMGKLYRIAGTRVQLERADAGHSISAATTDVKGTRWLSVALPTTPGSFTVTGRTAGGTSIVFPVPWTTTQFASDPTNPDVLWFHALHLVHRAAPVTGGAYRITDSFRAGGIIHEILVDRRGVVWAVGVDSGSHGRITRIERGVVSTFGAAEGVPRAPLRGIHEDADGVLWIGSYGAGITRLKNGAIGTVSEPDGLFENVVSTILEDDAGNLWFGGNRSIHRVKRSDLNAFLDGSLDRVIGVGYGRGDGLVNPEGSGNPGYRGLDGRLWFPTFNGAAVVDPAVAIALDSVPPFARVVALRAGDDAVDLGAGGRLTASQRQLEFEFAAVALRNPERVRSVYRLDGFDPAWTTAASDGRVTYRGLSPGSYTFRVRALNAGGVWSAAEATFPFTIAPHVYEQGWFAGLTAAMMAGLIFAGYTGRVRSLLRREQVLARRVDERTAELAAETRRTEDAMRIVVDQSEKLRSLDKAKSRLVANVSHEFRTPLSLVIGPLEDVRDGRSGPIPEEARKRLDRGLVNARRLVSLVDQLLDAALLESGNLRLRLESADLVGLLRRLAESFSSMAERQGIRFRIATPVGGLPVRFDPDQLDKVFTNLLGNAFKFTARGGEVTLEAWREGEGTSAAAVVAVRDTGIGIAPEHASQVFDRFYQVDDSHSRAYEGAGLGLAITKELVELHGGSIAVESRLTHGTTFTVRLPVSTDVVVSGASIKVTAPQESQPVDVAAESDAPDTALDVRTTVLLVEDNTELRAYLRDLLKDEYRVLEAGRGDQALELARATVPDLIVSDIMMPGMDGQSLCEAVKADAEIGFVPVILLTAKASLDSKLTGLQGGADDYLTKPVDRRELLVRIENIIRSRRRLRERFAEAHRDLPAVAATWRTVDQTTDVASVEWLRRLSDVIAEELANEDLDAERLAERMSMSRSALYRQTERLLDRSPMAVVWDRRLDQAALWLAQADANVSEIAYAVGFKSVPHFSTRFRAKFGESPSAHRGRLRPVP